MTFCKLTWYLLKSKNYGFTISRGGGKKTPLWILTSLGEYPEDKKMEMPVLSIN